MDFSLVLDRLARSSRFRFRVPSLPKAAPQIRRAASGASALILGLSLAWFAHQASTHSGVRSWHRENHPSHELWESVLKSRNWKWIEDPTLAHRWLRTLPSIGNPETGETWFSSYPLAVIVSGTGAENLPRVYLPENAPLKPGVTAVPWEPIGLGWPGLDLTLRRIAALPRKPSLSVGIQKKTKSPSDPKLLIY